MPNARNELFEARFNDILRLGATAKLDRLWRAVVRRKMRVSITGIRRNTG